MDPLTDIERKLIGFALFSAGMKLGPPSFDSLEKIVAKIGVNEEFEFYAKDWIEDARTAKTNEAG